MEKRDISLDSLSISMQPCSMRANEKNDSLLGDSVFVGSTSQTIRSNLKNVNEEILEAILKAKQAIRICHHEICFQANESNSINQLRTIEKLIFSKDLQIKHIEQEIKQLKTNRHQSWNSNSIRNQIIFKITEVETLSAHLKKKEKEYRQTKLRVDRILQQYHSKCSQISLKPLTNSQILENLLDKKEKSEKKIIMNKGFRFEQKPKMFRKQTGGHNKVQGISKNRTISEMIDRKNVAEAALKAEKKKHTYQMNNNLNKLEFLKDEEEILEEKVYIKIKQLQKASKKFSQTNKIIIERKLKKQ